MHCPTCRADNALTTRFCTSCGAVLVEEAPGGGRRRVLRPWGLRRSAPPPTIAPDYPDLAPPAEVRVERAWRMDLWLAAAVVAIVLVVAVVHPSLRSTDAAPLARADERVVTAPAVVSLPSPAVVRETRLAAPALVERASPRPKAERADSAEAVEAPTQRPGARGPVVVAVAYPLPARDNVIGDGKGEAALPAAVAPASAPAPDRWQLLRGELERCAPLGLFERATCEQSARLAHCESFWGHVDLCPQMRTGSGQ